MLFDTPPTLAGERATLIPLEPAHAADLAIAVDDGKVWDAWYATTPRPEQIPSEIERRLGLFATGSMLPWTITETASGKPVGMTTLMNIDEGNRHVEIGSTWLAKSAQRTGINTEAKLMLLGLAFDELDCIAVEIRTHWHNRQSRAAIAALGAKQDGVLRNHRIGKDGTLRDTVVFSIIASEWPTVRLGLLEKLRAHAK